MASFRTYATRLIENRRNAVAMPRLVVTMRTPFGDMSSRATPPDIRRRRRPTRRSIESFKSSSLTPS